MSDPGSGGASCAGSSGRMSTSTGARSPWHNNRVVVAGHARDKAGGKTENADQTISVDRATASALEKWRVIQDGERDFFCADYHPGDYVFTFADGRPPHPDTIRQRFDRLAAAAGFSRITFHDLRHSYATGALKAGISPKVVSQRIGHANARTRQRRPRRRRIGGRLPAG